MKNIAFLGARHLVAHLTTLTALMLTLTGALLNPSLADDAGPVNEAAWLTDGMDSLKFRLQTLQRARKSVRIQALIFHADESGLFIAELLKKKRTEGLDVRVIVDATSNPELQTQFMYYDLKMHGVEVEGYEAGYLQWLNEVSIKDPLVFNKRYHDKLWIIDGEDPDGVAVLGGLNIGNEYFRVPKKPAQRWRDQDVALKGPILKDIVDAFESKYTYFKNIKKSRSDLFNTDSAWKNWRKLGKWTHGIVSSVIDAAFSIKEQQQKRIRDASEEPLNPEFLPVDARFVQSRPRFNERLILDEYLRQIKNAEKEILIANAYFIPTRPIRKALKEAAKRDVKIKVITNSTETNDLPQLTYVSRYFYEELMQKGIEIYEWRGDKHGEGTIHAKFAIFDNLTAIVGSYNLDPRSERLNSETIAVIRSDKLVPVLASQFLERDLAKSVAISPEQAEKFHSPTNLQYWIKLNTSLPLESLF